MTPYIGSPRRCAPPWLLPRLHLRPPISYNLLSCLPPNTWCCAPPSGPASPAPSFAMVRQTVTSALTGSGEIRGRAPPQPVHLWIQGRRCPCPMDMLSGGELLSRYGPPPRNLPARPSPSGERGAASTLPPASLPPRTRPSNPGHSPDPAAPNWYL